MNGAAKSAVLGLLGVVTPFIWQQSAALDAAGPAGGGANSLDEIVVTAEKREEKLKDVPMSVTALGGSKLDNLQAVDFADYAALVPGLSLQAIQPGNTRLTLRGQNAGGVGSTVAVYLDDAPFGSSNALLNGSINTGDFDTWDMQRIEVLRGPQGTLFGADSEAGTVRYITNQPSLTTFSGFTHGELAETEKGGLSYELSSAVGGPIIDDTLGFRLSAYARTIVTDPTLLRQAYPSPCRRREPRRSIPSLF